MQTIHPYFPCILNLTRLTFNACVPPILIACTWNTVSHTSRIKKEVSRSSRKIIKYGSNSFCTSPLYTNIQLYLFSINIILLDMVLMSVSRTCRPSLEIVQWLYFNDKLLFLFIGFMQCYFSYTTITFLYFSYIMDT